DAMMLRLLLFGNVGRGATEDFLFRPAEDPLGRRIPQLDPALRVEGLERQRRGPDHGLERLVALPERPLGPLAFGHQLLGPAPLRPPTGRPPHGRAGSASAPPPSAPSSHAARSPNA